MLKPDKHEKKFMRAGVPYTHEGIKSSVTEEHFSFVIDELKNAYYELTNKEIMPWFE